MALFPYFELEDRVQINDKTRFNGKRSFVSKGSSAITTMTIKPGADGSAIDVFDSDTDERYLDWQFSAFEIDIDATNNKLDFEETSGVELTATLTSATYTLATLATEIETQLNATGANTYTVTVSDDDKVTIAADSDFSLLPQTGTNRLISILPILNFKPKPGFGDSEFANLTTTTGVRVRKMPRAVTLEIGDGATTESVTRYIQVLSVDGDALFSSDQDLTSHRHDILDWLPDSRNSFLHIHRRAQDLILDHLHKAGYVDIFGDPLTIDAVVNPEDVKQWSIFATLRIIHFELSNDPEDEFYEDGVDYQASEEKVRDRVLLRVDIDRDGKSDLGEGVQLTGGVVLRR